MKKRIFLFTLLGLAMMLSAEDVLTLDDAIASGSQQVSNKLSAGSKIVVLNIQADSPRMTDYLNEELTYRLVNEGKLDVLDRKNLSLVQQEMQFQLSGEVSDDSAQAIGRKLGAQSIVSGSFEFLGSCYRLRIRTIEVETAKILALASYSVKKDTTTETLMGSAAAPVQGAGGTAVSARPVAQRPAPNPNRVGFRLYGGAQTSNYGTGYNLFSLWPLPRKIVMGVSLAGVDITEYQPVGDYTETRNAGHLALGLGFAQPASIFLFSGMGLLGFGFATVHDESYYNTYLDTDDYYGIVVGGDVGFDIRLGFLLVGAHAQYLYPGVANLSLMGGIRF